MDSKQPPTAKPAGPAQPLKPQQGPSAQRPNPPTIKPLASPPPPDDAPKSKWKILSGATVGGLIVGKLGIKLLLGGFVTQAQVEASRFETWSPEFRKSITDGCNQSAAESMKSSAPAGTSDVQIRALAATYCDCMSSKLEAAHVLRTKYNTLTESESSLEQSLTAAVNTYMESPDGKAATTACGDAALEKDKATAEAQPVTLPAAN